MSKAKRLASILMVLVMALTATTGISFAADSPTAKAFNEDTVTVKVDSATYDGTAKTPNVTVTLKDGTELVKGKDYAVALKDSVNAGEQTLVIVGINDYAGSVFTSYVINKAVDDTATVTASKATVKYKTVKKKKQTVKLSVKAKDGYKVSYKVTKYPSKAKKYISVSKNGTVTLKKGAKKGTYKVKVTITNANYETVTKTITIKVK